MNLSGITSRSIDIKFEKIIKNCILGGTGMASQGFDQICVALEQENACVKLNYYPVKFNMHWLWLSLNTRSVDCKHLSSVTDPLNL